MYQIQSINPGPNMNYLTQVSQDKTQSFDVIAWEFGEKMLWVTAPFFLRIAVSPLEHNVDFPSSPELQMTF